MAAATVAVAAAHVLSVGTALAPVTLGLMSAGLVVLLVFGHSRVGWLLTACGPARVLAGIALDPLGYFEPTRLVDSILWIVVLLASVGLVAWSLPRRPV